MSQLIPIYIPQENNILLIIQFTRTSSTFSRQLRIEGLESLVDRCSRAIETCLEARDAAFATIEEGAKHRASLFDIRSDLTWDMHRNLVQMADDVRARNRKELEAIGRDLRRLMSCKRKAERGLAEAKRTT
ncbi:hypothetical protein MMC22_006703 [Lobaria immixta]|nr:hypothetical protein [Lobaria immixta]